MTSANVTFYSDASGLPGSQVATRPNLSVVDSAGSIMIAIPTAVELTAGHYWVSVQANLDFNVGGQWYFEDRTVQSNAEAAWQNPGGGFGICPTWGGRQSTCADRPRCARSGLPPERHHRASASASAATTSATASASASATASASASAASATSASAAATSATSASATSASASASASAGPVPRPTRARPAARSCEAEDPGKALLGRQGPARSLEALPQGTRHRPVAAARLAPAARLPGQPRGRPRLSHFN